MKVLVIGAAGKTGRAAVQKAVAVGHEVRAVMPQAGNHGGSGVRVIEGD